MVEMGLELQLWTLARITVLKDSLGSLDSLPRRLA